MKKIIYTASLIVLFAAAGSAQSTMKEQEPKKENQTAPAAKQAPVKAPTAAEQPKTSGTRMAINEKGVPASKPNTNAAKEKKEEKPASPGQPAGVEKH